MQTPRVSIIVTAFNVEKYIAECLNSLLVQDLKELEIIVVNDGSTDKTTEIVSRYAESHAHVQVINQQNLGLSAARNVGMKVAKGQYLGFVDGDDWVHSSMYLAMHEKALLTQADLVITNGYFYNDMTGDLKPIQDFAVWAKFKTKNCELALNPRSESDLFLLDTSACKRFYKRSFLVELNFEFMPGKIFEDVATHYKLLLNSSAVALLDRPFYYYRTHRPGRITAKKDETLFQVFDVMAEVIRDLREKGADEQIWANYIWFQNWVLRWLRKQIESSHLEAFDLRCFENSKAFHPAAVEVFNDKFASDKKAVEFVRLQISNTLNKEL